VASPDADVQSRVVQQTTPVRTLRGHTEGITALQLLTSTTGVMLAASASVDSTIRLWGLAPLLPSPFRSAQVLRGHGQAVWCMVGLPAVASDEDALLASGGSDEKVKVWNAAGRSTGVAKLKEGIRFLEVGEGWLAGTLVAGGCSSIQVVDMRSMKGGLGVKLQPGIHSMALHQHELCAGCEDGARVFDLRMAGASPAAAKQAPRERLLLHGHVGPVRVG
jgi:WD40 repeat protein